TNSHPKRTQHVAFHVWEAHAGGSAISVADVQEAFDALITSGKDNTDFTKIMDALLSGPDPEENEAKALFLTAGGGSPSSEGDARRYGLGSTTTARRALDRLRDRGIIQRRGTQWVIVDPLLDAWLRRQNPVQIEPAPSPPALPAGEQRDQ